MDDPRSPVRPNRSRLAATVAGVTAALALATVIVAALAVAPAAAGGASWKVERDGYRPGELVDARSGVSWLHNPDLGQPEEGPYHAYLLPFDPDAADTADLAAQVERATYVGDVEIVLGPIPMDPAGSGVRSGPNGAILRFLLPALAPGRYSILHCATPCRTYLGDLMSGTVTVLNPDGSHPIEATNPAPAPPPATDADAPTTAPPTTRPAAPTSSTSAVANAGTVHTGDVVPVLGALPSPSDDPQPGTAAVVAATAAAALLALGVLAWRGGHRRWHA